MDRLACVELPQLPLQVLLRREPSFAGGPAAVVEADKPLGLVLWVNERARRAGVLPGMRYAAARALAPELRAGVVEATEIDAVVSAVAERLYRFSPRVEAGADGSGDGGAPGTFWLDAAGLERLFPSLLAWGDSICGALRELGLGARVAVGFTRFGTAAVARALARSRTRRVIVCDSPTDEKRLTERVPLDRLWSSGLPPATRDALALLGVRTVADFVALPAAGVRRRFGKEALRLHELAHGAFAPFTPRPPEEHASRRVELDFPESDTGHLVFLVKRELDPLLARLAARVEALASLTLTLTVEKNAGVGGAMDPLTLRPAEPTLDAALLLELVRLRCETLALTSGVVRLDVAVSGVRATREQLALYLDRAKPKRDLAAADRALARVRAQLGDESVVRARLREGHMPEAQFVWEPVASVGRFRLDDSGATGPGSGSLSRASLRGSERTLPRTPTVSD